MCQGNLAFTICYVNSGFTIRYVKIAPRMFPTNRLESVICDHY